MTLGPKLNWKEYVWKEHVEHDLWYPNIDAEALTFLKLSKIGKRRFCRLRSSPRLKDSPR